MIPDSLHRQILEELYVAHPGIVRMKEIARSHVWWPKIDSDIEATVRQCGSCQETRPLPSVAPLTPWLWPGKPWQHVHMDFAVKEGTNFLVAIDAYSKWPEIIPMKSTTATAMVVVVHDMFADRPKL